MSIQQNHDLCDWLASQVGSTITIKDQSTSWTGELMTMSTGTAILKGIKKTFFHCDAFVGEAAELNKETKTLTLMQSAICDTPSDCTCHIDPSKCCDQDGFPLS